MKEPKADIHIKIPLKQKKQIEAAAHKHSKLSPSRVYITDIIVWALEDAGVIKE